MKQTAAKKSGKTHDSGSGELPKKKKGPMAESPQGGGDLADALGKLQGKKEDRLEGATALQGLQSPESFEPLLAAAEKEEDSEVKCELLKALSSTSNAGKFTRPEDTVNRLEAILFSETNDDVMKEVNMALYHFCPGTDKRSAQIYFDGLLERAEKKFGPEHPVVRGINNMKAYGTAADLF